MTADGELLIDYLRVGVVQTTLDAKQAWHSDSAIPRISPSQDSHVWLEICRAMRSFVDGGEKPKIVLLPELSLPRTRLDDFERLVASLNVMAFVGVDYQLDHTGYRARNEGIVFIPRGFWQDRPSRSCVRVVFGKSHAAPKEKTGLAKFKPPWSFSGDHNVYVFDAEQYGNIAVSICYDFMDVERALMFRGRVHHLFVLAYNQDLGMFRALAESLSRTVFCNVVVCNTGFHGGSIAVSPYFEAHRRVLFGHDGKGLYTAQVVHLPVAGLNDALLGLQKTVTKEGRQVREFKDRPPGLRPSVG